MSTPGAAESDQTPVPPPWKGVRHQPSIRLGLVVYLGYLAIFFATWTVNGVDYPTLGNTLESTKLHYALPTLFGCCFVVVAITVLGWWRVTLFDDTRSGPLWAWIGPTAMFLLAVGAFLQTNWDNASGALVVWSVLGAIGVGFGEEMITRGAMLVGFRATSTEVRAWLFSTLVFSALHLPNVLFGQSIGGTAAQLVLTFVLGSMLWATRRLGGTLLLCMFLHGFWDSSVFLPDATGAEQFTPQLLLYPLAIVTVVGVVRRNRGAVVR